ncbi:MAG: TetR/AcrR family transcriptional regulator [candidate division KSB1 bacterium]|nr:TetR/AcrR family transcriptional regulator [candidate division KSB1 bacterium]
MNESKRTRLLKAAIKVFARHGFFKSKVEDIAKEAGVATGTTYLYFENKDDLLISIFEEEMAPIIERIRTLMQEKSTATEKIITFIEQHFEIVKNNPDLAVLFEVELRQSNKFLHNYHGTRFKEYLDIIGTAFSQGQEKGEFRTDIHPSIFKQIVFGAVDHISSNYALSASKNLDLNIAAQMISDTVLNGVVVK